MSLHVDIIDNRFDLSVQIVVARLVDVGGVVEWSDDSAPEKKRAWDWLLAEAQTTARGVRAVMQHYADQFAGSASVTVTDPHEPADCPLLRCGMEIPMVVGDPEPLCIPREPA